MRELSRTYQKSIRDNLWLWQFDLQRECPNLVVGQGQRQFHHVPPTHLLKVDLNADVLLVFGLVFYPQHLTSGQHSLLYIRCTITARSVSPTSMDLLQNPRLVFLSHCHCAPVLDKDVKGCLQELCGVLAGAGLYHVLDRARGRHFDLPCRGLPATLSSVEMVVAVGGHWHMQQDTMLCRSFHTWMTHHSCQVVYGDSVMQRVIVKTDCYLVCVVCISLTPSLNLLSGAPKHPVFAACHVVGHRHHDQCGLRRLLSGAAAWSGGSERSERSVFHLPMRRRKTMTYKSYENGGGPRNTI